MRARICSAVAWGSGGPPQAWRRSLWMTPCGWPVRWFQAPTRPFSSLRRAPRASRLTGGAASSGGWCAGRAWRAGGSGELAGFTGPPNGS